MTRAGRLAELDAEAGIDLGHGIRPSREDADLAPVDDLADALTEVCAAYLRGKIAAADNPDVYQVIIHAGAGAITEDATAAAPTADPASGPPGASAEAPRRWPASHPAREDRCHVEDGPAISPSALRYIGCNATVSAMAHDADGSILAVGRRSRSAPAALRRAVRERDRYRCRFPGCESRKVDLHHIRYWSSGGQTSLANLVCLCKRHHRVVHDKGYIITGTGEFRTPAGTLIPHSPPLPRPVGDITTSHDASIAYHTIIPPHSGERLNLHEAIWTCLHNAELNAERRRQPQPRQQPQRAA
jgi:5-methylcytosine-specific restriction endonuclease McrA